MNFLSISWLWLYTGALLMFFELVTPGFVIFFFGLSAMTVGLLLFVIGESLDMTWQILLFSVISVFYIVLLRRWLKRIFSGEVQNASTDFNHEMVGRVGKVIVAINPPLQGRVEIGDAEWTAIADEALAVGTDVRVVAQNNLTMKLERLGS